MIVLRPANIADAKRLFEWRNDEVTRANSVSTAPVEWGSHVAWLERRLSVVPPNLFIGEMDGAPVGTLRVDGDEVSYTVAPEWRGKGIATSMLTQAYDLFGPLVAQIKPTNNASIRAAEKAGHQVHLLPDGCRS